MEKEKKLSPLPSIKELFKQSFVVFEESILKLILVGVAFWVGIFLVTVLAGIILLVLFGGYFIGKAPIIPPVSLMVIGVIIVFLYLIACFIIALTTAIAPILIVGKSKEGISFGQAIKKSFSYIIPFYVTNIIVALVCFGGFFVFILPAIAFSFLFIFVGYEVVLNDKRFFGAIRRSVLVVSRRFGQIFVRVFIFFIAYLFLVGVIPSLLGSSESGNVFATIFIVLINFVVGYFSLCYYVTLYKQARVGLEEEKAGSYWWIWVVAVLGWMIFFALIFIVSTLIVGLIQQAGPSLLQNLENVPSIDSDAFQQIEGI